MFYVVATLVGNIFLLIMSLRLCFKLGFSYDRSGWHVYLESVSELGVAMTLTIERSTLSSSFCRYNTVGIVYRLYCLEQLLQPGQFSMDLQYWGLFYLWNWRGIGRNFASSSIMWSSASRVMDIPAINGAHFSSLPHFSASVPLVSIYTTFSSLPPANNLSSGTIY